MEKKRLGYIDVAKGIGILLVVFAHCLGKSGKSGVNNVPFYVIYSFHMPLFFFLSGILYRARAFKDYFTSKVTSLIIPTLIFEIINELIYFAAHFIHQEKYADISGFGTLWFLKTLFIITVIYYVLDTVVFKGISDIKIKRAVLTIISLIFIIISHVFFNKTNGSGNSLNSALGGIFFFNCGYVFKDLFKLITEKSSKTVITRIISVVVCAALIGVLCYLAPLNNHEAVSMYIARYNNLFKCIINAFIGIIAIWLISSAINHNKFLEYCGRNSLMIYILHMPFFKWQAQIYSHFKINVIINLFANFIITTALTILCVAAVNKWFPFFAGKIKYESVNSEDNKIVSGEKNEKQ